MIKYANIRGYNNIGEIELFSHIYQFIEINKDEPMIILVHAYEGPTEVFKGYLYNKRKQFRSVDLLEDEIREIEKYCGELNQVEFNDFINKTIFRDDFTDFTKQPKYKSEA